MGEGRAHESRIEGAFGQPLRERFGPWRTAATNRAAIPVERLPPNRPFHSLAQEYTDLVCGMNLDPIDGFLCASTESDSKQPLILPPAGVA